MRLAPRGAPGCERADALGRRTRRTVNGADPVDIGYDKTGRPTAITFRNRTTTTAYDPAGRPLHKTLPNGLRQEYAFDDANRLTEIVVRRADGSVLETVTTTHDAAGRRTRRAATVAGIAETPMDATYGPDNRLTGLTLGGIAYSVAYDENGNLTQKTAQDGTSTRYTWDAANRLTAIESTAPATASAPASGLSATFKYDALGRRVEKTVNGKTVAYLYDGAQAIAEIRNHAIDAHLLTGLAIDEAIARYSSAGERSLLTDALGSVILAAKEDGTVATAYGYSPYGETAVMGEDEGNATQYTGRENDGTGLYFYRARYYDAALKRFVSEDPIGVTGGINQYVYVDNAPTMKVDPTGETPLMIPVVGLVGGLIAGAIINNMPKPGKQGNASDDPLGGAAGSGAGAGAGSGAQSCPPNDKCEEQAKKDEQMCRMTTMPKTGARARCWASVQDRYGACKAGHPLPPLVMW